MNVIQRLREYDHELTVKERAAAAHYVESLELLAREVIMRCRHCGGSGRLYRQCTQPECGELHHAPCPECLAIRQVVARSSDSASGVQK